MQIRRCSNCGKEDYEHNMHAYYTGRTQWICEECYTQGHRDANYRDIVRDLRTRKDRKWQTKK